MWIHVSIPVKTGKCNTLLLLLNLGYEQTSLSFFPSLYQIDTVSNWLLYFIADQKDCVCYSCFSNSVPQMCTSEMLLVGRDCYCKPCRSARTIHCLPVYWLQTAFITSQVLHACIPVCAVKFISLFGQLKKLLNEQMLLWQYRANI